MKVFALAAFAAFVVAGCSPNTSVSQQQFGSSQVMIAPGNLRLITERDREGRAITCTEPSPDYAVAFGSKLSASVKTTQPGGASVDASGGFDRTEAITPGGGRAEAVLALRDGLYAACQAYANGVIGKDAYSLILSQYGALLAAVVNDKAGDYKNDGTAALLTACISAHDPSRIPPMRNALLDTATCRAVLRRVGRA